MLIASWRSRDDADAQSIFGRFAQSVRSAVRRQDTLASETDTRAWIIAARHRGAAARTPWPSGIAAAVRESPSWRGAPLAVSVGGRRPRRGRPRLDRDLIEAAEEARFAAEATGITVARDRASGVRSPWRLVP